MTLFSLFIYVGIAALLLTFLIARAYKKSISLPDSFLQNFAGSLFVFSGFVKAVDPLGTAYKMEQYFTAFEDTCKGSFLKFLAPIFPWFSQHSISFSVFMIVLEIVLGIMLIIGYQKRLASWLFFAIMVFFTVLTGFTYLTGYVPTEANFFEFSKWTEYNKNQMRVTDCGCFGDFIKLEPKISFFKDLILMIPAFWFIFRWKHCHEIFSPIIRMGITFVSTLALCLFCFSNFVWNEPIIDFRPFKNGVNIKTTLAAEQKAMADVEILAYKIRNRIDKHELEVPAKDFLDSFKNNPNFKASWETLDQIKSEPKIPRTKISDFEILYLDGNPATESFLDETKFNLVIISPKVKYTSVSIKEERLDSIYRMDTVIIKLKNKDSIRIDRVLVGTEAKTVKRNKYEWNEDYLNILKSTMLPLMDSVKDLAMSSAIFGSLTEEGIADLKLAAGIDFPCYEADDLLLKTIMRSNPGLLLMQNGQIIQKWHYKQLPDVEELRNKYLNGHGTKIY